MIPIRVVFSLSIACAILPRITSVPRQNNFESERRTNRAISDGSQDLHQTQDNHQTQEVVDNHHGENSNQNLQKDASNGSSSSEPLSLHGETAKTVENSTSFSKTICQACYCKNPFHEVCFEHKCCNRTKYYAQKPSQKSVSNHSTSTVYLSTNKTVLNDDHREDVVPNSEIDLQGTDEHEENCSLKNDSVIESEKPLPSKPATFDSDVSNETSAASNDASALFNTWTVIFIIVLTSTSLISAFKYAKQWRRDRMRENYLIDGLYTEARPLCLNDVLD